MATIKTVETLTAGDIATFRQDPEFYNGHQVTRREKVTKTTELKTGVKVETINRRGKKDSYIIPTGTEMRVHNVKEDAAK